MKQRPSTEPWWSRYLRLKIWFPGWTEKIAAAIKVYGTSFLLYAVLVNLLDDIIIPAIFALIGYPLVGSMLFIGDFDWLTYPLYFVFAARFHHKNKNKIK